MICYFILLHVQQLQFDLLHPLMKIKTFRKLATPLQKDETCKLDMAVLIAFPIVFLVSVPVNILSFVEKYCNWGDLKTVLSLNFHEVSYLHFLFDPSDRSSRLILPLYPRIHF